MHASYTPMESTVAELDDMIAERSGQLAREWGLTVKLSDEGGNIMEDSQKKMMCRKCEQRRTQQSKCVHMLYFQLLRTDTTREGSLSSMSFVAECRRFEVHWRSLLRKSSGGKRTRVSKGPATMVW